MAPTPTVLYAVLDTGLTETLVKVTGQWQSLDPTSGLGARSLALTSGQAERWGLLQSLKEGKPDALKS
jgi:hypothetical protein